MPKLHFKRTTGGEETRRFDKKEARRRKRGYEDGNIRPSPRKRPRAMEGFSERKWASSDDDYGPQPASKDDEMEETQFQEKLCDAFADDERLDSLEARLNGYAPMPARWRSRFEDDAWLRADPQTMDEEQYAEWIRVGMYRCVGAQDGKQSTQSLFNRKTYANEYAEQQKRKAERAAHRADEKRKRKTKEMSKEDSERTGQRQADARAAYEHQWTALLGLDNKNADIGFADIPWPVMGNHRPVLIADLTADAVAAFLLPGGVPGHGRSRKEVLRETLLRFHPDKFEGRLMQAVRAEEQAVVREGVGRVVRVLNSLMAE